METVLLKYHSGEEDYLVCDTWKNHMHLDSRTIRAICARGFGVGARGLVAGCVDPSGHLSMHLYAPDGRMSDMDDGARRAFSRYLEDAGYGRQHADGAEMIGKIFLSDEFFEKNCYAG